MATGTAATHRLPVSVSPAWWRYIERDHNHAIVAEWEETKGSLRIRESSRDAPGAELLEEQAIAEPWEARLAIWLLEGRLATLGHYLRARVGESRWSALSRPMGVPLPDPRANQVLVRPHALLHHYHEVEGSQDTLLAALPDAAAARFTVLRAKLDVADLEIGAIDVLRTGLPLALTKSLVMREEIAFTQSRTPKLVTRDDYERAFGRGAQTRVAKLVDEVVQRASDGDLAAHEKRADETDVYAEFLVRLQDPRLHALHRRFLDAGAEERVLRGGPVEIRKVVLALRTEVDHAQQHLLTILEASLLARERMRHGGLVRGAPEVRALTRLAYYL